MGVAKCHILCAPPVIALEHVNDSEKSYQKKLLQHFPNFLATYLCSVITIVILLKMLWETAVKGNKLVLKRSSVIEFLVESNTVIIYVISRKKAKTIKTYKFIEEIIGNLKSKSKSGNIILTQKSLFVVVLFKSGSKKVTILHLVIMFIKSLLT